MTTYEEFVAWCEANGKPVLFTREEWEELN